jgi:hypothetical protein
MRLVIPAVLAVLFIAPLSHAEPHLRYLPSDTKMVLTIHVPALGKQDQEGGERLLRQLYFGRLLPELARPGESPWSALSRVVLAFPHAGTLSGIVVLRGKIDRKRFEQQLREAMKTSKALSVEELGKPAAPVFRRKLDEGGWLELAPQLALVPAAVRKLIVPQDVYLAALDDETLLISLAGKTPVVRALRARPADTAPRTTDALTKVLQKQDPKDVAAFALLDDSLAPALALLADDATRETFEQFDHITARVRGGKEVGITVEARAKSDDLGPVLQKKAGVVVKLLEKAVEKAVPDKGRRAILETLLRALKVSRMDARVTVTGKLDEADARKLLPR